ncbi:MAG: hypothetical protein MN733_12660 [Nitrososphaera sp.]|nr:hypothetical protein [Nitrososphaera sp.]
MKAVNRCPINDDFQPLSGFDLEPSQELIYKAASNDFLALEIADALIINESKSSLEVVREVNVSFKAASNLSQ